MTEIQIIILKAELRQRGISDIKALRIIDLLADKPENVQLALYYRCLGCTQQAISDIIGVSQPQVKYYLSENCTEIQEYLKII